MRLLSRSLSTLALVAHAAVFTCNDHRDHFDRFDDVTVDVTGTAGTPFDATLEDDRRDETLSGVVPFSADFTDQRGFFRATVDKKSGGSEQICVKVVSSQDTRHDCTTAPNGRVSVTVFF